MTAYVPSGPALWLSYVTHSPSEGHHIGRHQMILYLYAAAAHHAAACTDSHYWGTSEACQWHLARNDFGKAGVTGFAIFGLLVLVIIGAARSIRRSRRSRR